MNALHPLLVATRNLGKLEELRQMLSHLPFDLYGLERFPSVEGFRDRRMLSRNASLKPPATHSTLFEC